MESEEVVTKKPAGPNAFLGGKYSAHLPRRRRGLGPCMAMDQDGERCDMKATIEGEYHGADDAEDVKATPWVVTHLCDYHGRRHQKLIEKNLTTKEWFRRKKAGKLMFPDALTPKG